MNQRITVQSGLQDLFNGRGKELLIEATRELTKAFLTAEEEYRTSHGIDVQIPARTPEDVSLHYTYNPQTQTHDQVTDITYEYHSRP